MSGGDFFDESEFGSASANDAPWETMGESIMNNNTQDVGVGGADNNAFMMNNNDFSNATTTGAQPPVGDDDLSNPSNAATVASSYVPPSTTTYTPPTMSMEPSNHAREMTSSSNSSRRQSMEDLASSNNAALREWEKDHEEKLEQKREMEERLKEERRKQAQDQLVQFYKERNERLQKIRQQNRTNETEESEFRQQASSSDLPSNSKESWTRVCDLVEFTSTGASASQATASSKLSMQVESKASTVSAGKGKVGQSGALNGTSSPPPKQPLQQPTTKDTSRMQQLLLQLKTSNLPSSSSPFLSNGISALSH